MYCSFANIWHADTMWSILSRHLLLLLNILLLCSKQRYVIAVLLINVKNKNAFLSTLDGLLPVCGLLQRHPENIFILKCSMLVSV